ncbi:hypothetical protein C8Q76DRAFT_443619 [Earliella scabrosa]|nr:hypothetical protein C8Q76DRAFT_443619 [Earliella scabrosa]
MNKNRQYTQAWLIVLWWAAKSFRCRHGIHSLGVHNQAGLRTAMGEISNVWLAILTSRRKTEHTKKRIDTFCAKSASKARTLWSGISV